MKGNQIVGIVTIFILMTIAWMILGAIMIHRTDTANTSLKGMAIENIGGVHRQYQPYIFYTRLTRNEDGKSVTEEVPFNPAASDIDVSLNVEHKRKGLIWYATYTVDFAGTFTFKNTSGVGRTFTFILPWPSSEADYINCHVYNGTHDDEMKYNIKSSGLMTSLYLAPNDEKIIRTVYSSQGIDEWRYIFGDDYSVETVNNFRLAMHTDFDRINFPDNSRSPTERIQRADNGWDLIWQADNLITGKSIGMDVPNKLQPGEISARIIFAAPVCLLFFFLVIVIISLIKEINLHTMHYALLALAFFSFHLLLAYLADIVNLFLAFSIASAVSIGLVVSYLRLVVGKKFAFVTAGISQFLFLVLFSFSFFFKGYSGITITIGAVLTLFIVMQRTARIDWSKKFIIGKQPPAAYPAGIITPESTPPDITS